MAEEIKTLLARGWKAHQQKQHDQAERCYRQVLERAPDHGHAWCYLGMLCHDQGRFAESLNSYDRSLETQPSNAITYSNRGNTLRVLGRLEEAEASCRRALWIAPDYATPHVNLAVVLLRQGRLAEGWMEYEWRFKMEKNKPAFARHPRWCGEPLEGRTLLVHSEQGLGDAIHFIRYASLLKQRGARVIARVHQPLVPLLKRQNLFEQVFARTPTPPKFDFHIPLMSLPGALGTDLDSIPADVPYLEADPELVEKWKAELAQYQGLKVALAWHGNPAHPENYLRSFPEEGVALLTELPGVQLISVQAEPPEGRFAALRAAGRLLDLSDRLDKTSGPFMDTAAVMRACDLVLSCDTVYVHLAGALGCQTWLPLHFGADWRWLLRRDDSPWYPTLRLFRQARSREWNDVFLRIRDALAQRCQTLPCEAGD